jgi:hypothetical protein
LGALFIYALTVVIAIAVGFWSAITGPVSLSGAGTVLGGLLLLGLVLPILAAIGIFLLSPITLSTGVALTALFHLRIAEHVSTRASLPLWLVHAVLSFCAAFAVVVFFGYQPLPLVLAKLEPYSVYVISGVAAAICNHVALFHLLPSRAKCAPST